MKNAKILTAHKVNKFNENYIEVLALEPKSEDNAYHNFKIIVTNENNTIIREVELNFQDGGLKDVGVNGISDQGLIAIVLERVTGFQNGPYPSPENAEMISSLQNVLDLYEKRAKDREKRGVEGERKI